MIRGAVKRGLNALGYDIHRIVRPGRPQPEVVPSFDRIHYACGNRYLDGWLNVDLPPTGPRHYMTVDLVNRHPFPAGSFRFGFAEDFLEHLDQADSLIFLAEVYRTLTPGGVLRLSFPGLENVLRRHYGQPDFQTFLRGREGAFIAWGHKHFYGRGGIALVARHIGFDVHFVRFGESNHPELRAIDTRLEQADLNIHVELTKP